MWGCVVKIQPFPELAAYAEEEARAFYAALPPMSPQRTPRPVRRMTTTTEPGWDVVGSETTTWEEQSEEWRSAIVAAYVALLTDLSRRGSFLAVLDLVADRLKLDRSGGVILTPVAHRGSKVRDWIVEDWNGASVVVLTNSKITDPTAALAAIVAALWPAP